MKKKKRRSLLPKQRGNRNNRVARPVRRVNQVTVACPVSQVKTVKEGQDLGDPESPLRVLLPVKGETEDRKPYGYKSN